MCGICGKINFDYRNNVEDRLIQRMCEVMLHRGPDEAGYYIKDNLGLGVRRLSIIDRPLGHQPMSNEDKTIWIVFNGEIYNYLELTSFLKDKKHLFSSRCDTEVIVHLYEEYQDSCINYLQGMFAFAIWDEKRKRLFIARDRLGIKPLYYTITNGSLIFASEIKSILQDTTVEKKLNLEALDYYLSLGFIPHSETMFKGIQRLLPGHTLSYQDGEIKLREYWDISVRIDNLAHKEKLLPLLEEILTQTVHSHLMSEVPLGVFLSGGIDSTTIVCLMSQLSNQPISTFSIGFKKEKGFDESRYARRVAKLFNTNHHEFIIEPNAIEILPRLIWHLEEPLADPAAIGLYYLSQMAKDYVKVVLVGEGGDETFAGYPRYYWHRKADLYNRFPFILREKIFRPLIEILPSMHRAKKFIRYASQPESIRYAGWFNIFSEEAKDEIYSSTLKPMVKDCKPSISFLKYFAQSPFTDTVSRAQYVDMKTYLVNNLLLKTDKITSSFSLEARVPFLDHRLVEFLASVPVNLKLKGNTYKYILKQLLLRYLPPELIRRRKQGFIFPIQSWFKGDLAGYATDILLDYITQKRGLFDTKVVAVLLERLKHVEHPYAQYTYAQQIYALINLEIWNRIFIDGEMCRDKS